MALGVAKDIADADYNEVSDIHLATSIAMRVIFAAPMLAPAAVRLSALSSARLNQFYLSYARRSVRPTLPGPNRTKFVSYTEN